MVRLSRPISWLKAVRKDFESFPLEVQEDCKVALGLAAEGSKAEKAKPLRGLAPGVFEIAIAYRGNAFRVVYAVRLDRALWVIHAFQKKSVFRIKTPKHEIDLIEDRLKRLKQMLEEQE